MKKRGAVLLALIALAFSAAGFYACEESVKSTEVLLDGYESYDDFLKIDMVSRVKGTSDVCSDRDKITQGESSWKLCVDFSEYRGKPVYEYEHYAMWKYSAELLDERAAALNRVEEYAIDVYNDSEEELYLYFAATGEGTETYFNDGARLAAKSWNYLKISPRSAFFTEKDKAEEFRFYLTGVAESKTQKATLYIDNFRVKAYESGAGGAVNVNRNGGGTEKEILDFNDVSHLNAVLPVSKFIYGDKSAWGTEAFLPLCALKQIPGIKIGEREGVLCAEFNRNDIEPEAWYSPEGYRLKIHSSVAAQAAGAKKITLVCANPDMVVHAVSIVAKKGDSQYVCKENVLPDETKKIVLSLDGAEFDSSCGLEIKIDAWSQTGQGRLYFADLRFSA